MLAAITTRFLLSTNFASQFHSATLHNKKTFIAIPDMAMPSFKHFFILLVALGSLTVNAQPRDSVEGIHYVALPALVPTETNEDVIEVREIFWYGCPECFSLEPITTDYRNGVRGDVKMLRMPAIWNDIMALHARIYFTAIAVGAEDRIHQAAFSAIHEQNNPLRTPAQIKALFLTNGIDATAFDTAWGSDEIANQVQQAQLRTGDYAIDKLPSMIVNGRFKVTHNEQVFNHIELNIAVNQVIRRLRDERRSDF